MSGHKFHYSRWSRLINHYQLMDLHHVHWKNKRRAIFFMGTMKDWKLNVYPCVPCVFRWVLMRSNPSSVFSYSMLHAYGCNKYPRKWTQYQPGGWKFIMTKWDKCDKVKNNCGTNWMNHCVSMTYIGDTYTFTSTRS